MPLRQEITGFLGGGSTPAAIQNADQSNRTKKKSRATEGGSKTTGTPQDPPERTQLKSNRSPNPMTPNHVTDTSFHINDVSLTDMLISGNDSEAGSTVDSNANSLDAEARLQSQLAATALALEQETAEKMRLQNTIDLLQSEIEKHKRVQKVSKNEIRRITTENDNLRREMSRSPDMRRYNTSDNQEKCSNTDNSPLSNTDEDLATVKANLDSLRDYIMNAGEALLSAASDDLTTPEDNFIEVVSRRGRRLRNHRPENESQELDYVDHMSSSPAAQPISVVNGTGRTPQSLEVPVAPDYAAVCRRSLTGATSSGTVTGGPYLRQGPTSRLPNPSHRKQNPNNAQLGSRPSVPKPRDHVQSQSHRAVSSAPSTLIIGTSMVKGLGSQLAKFGANVTTYAYPGRDIPYTRSRPAIPRLGRSCYNVAGMTLNTTRLVTWHRSTNVLSMRWNNIAQMHASSLATPPPLNNITSINTWLKHRADRGNGVHTIEACPVSPLLFKRDMVHFNSKGLVLYAKRLKSHIQNFHRSPGQNYW